MNARPWEMPSQGGAAVIARTIAKTVPGIATARLSLRAPRIEDFDAYAEIVTTERGVHVGGPMTREEAWLDFAQMVAGWLLRGHGVWSVERREDGRLLGFVLIGFEPGDLEPELGFLFRAEAEGRGYAHEAGSAARGFAFATLGLPRVVSYVAPENSRSIRLVERLGGVREAQTVDGSLVFSHVPNSGGGPL
jgi:RimJ/RimL family protein N-acetyltransferase